MQSLGNTISIQKTLEDISFSSTAKVWVEIGYGKLKLKTLLYKDAWCVDVCNSKACCDPTQNEEPDNRDVVDPESMVEDLGTKVKKPGHGGSELELEINSSELPRLLN